MNNLIGRVFTALIIFAVLALSALASPTEPNPTFLIFKYQHIVGKEIDDCRQDAKGRRCHSHFQLDFTGSSISLDADIEIDPSFQPLAYAAKGQNSTRSYIDLNVAIESQRATVRDGGVMRTLSLPTRFFTLQQDVPILTQELLLAYWRNHGRPGRITILPAGEVRIWQRGSDQLPGGAGERLTRYTVHGVTWGNETVWLDSRGEIAAVVGADAEEDRVEVVRPRYQPALKEFVNWAAADAVVDLESAAVSVRPLAIGTFALTHATLINPTSDDTPLQDVTILVRNGRIDKVGRNVSLSPHVRVLDARGKFILPGLWDTHAHFEHWEWGPAYLASGITSVRDVGNEIEFLVPIRRSLDTGRGLGPRMYAAGLIDSEPGALTSEHAEGPEAA